MRSLTHAHTHSLTRSLTHSATRCHLTGPHSLTHSLTHALARSLTHALTRSLARSKADGSDENHTYDFEDSKSCIDGVFLGLPLDFDNESELSEPRVEEWVGQIAGEM